MKLTVKPLKQKDAGRGLAAVDRAARPRPASFCFRGLTVSFILPPRQ